MSVLGLSPLGTDLGPFGGPGLVTVLGVVPLSMTDLAIVFDRPVFAVDDATPDTAVRAANYELSTVDPTITASDGTTVVPKGERVPTRSPYIARAALDDIDPAIVVLTTDFDMESLVRYTVRVIGAIRGVNGESLAGPLEFGVRAPRRPRIAGEVYVTVDRYRDLDYVVSPREGDPTPPQSWRFDPSGDIGIQGGIESLRKRLTRRLFAQPGDFAWAADYGVGIKLKALARAGRLQQIANTVSDQAQQEPDVRAASTSVRTERRREGLFLRVNLSVERTDRTSATITLEEQVQ